MLKESGLLRRKLRALENRIDEIAKQLLESHETGAEEVAKRDKQLQRLRHSHKDEIENIKKQNQSSISQLRAELENSMKTLTHPLALKKVMRSLECTRKQIWFIKTSSMTMLSSNSFCV